MRCAWTRRGISWRNTGSPEGEITFESVDFLPVNVLADTNGFVYVLGAGMLEGAAVYTQDGVFQGYYGANTVEVTLSVAPQ